MQSSSIKICYYVNIIFNFMFTYQINKNDSIYTNAFCYQLRKNIHT